MTAKGEGARLARVAGVTGRPFVAIVAPDGAWAWQVACVGQLVERGMAFAGWLVADDASPLPRAARGLEVVLGPSFGLVGRARLEEIWGPAQTWSNARGGAFADAMNLDFRHDPTESLPLPAGGLWSFTLDGHPLASASTVAVAAAGPASRAFAVGLVRRAATSPSSPPSRYREHVLRRPRGWRAGRALSAFVAEAPTLVLAEVEEWAREGSGHEPAPAQESSAARVSEGSTRTNVLTAGDLLRVGLRDLAVAAQAFWQTYFFAEEWTIGVLPRDVTTLLEDPRTVDVQWLPVPRGLKLVADPFAFVANGALHVVFEAVGTMTDRGHIAIATLEELRAGRVHMLREAPHHLSYPFLFPFEGELYCIPEAHESGRVDLHRLVLDGGPRLVFQKTLLDGVDLCDPTLFQFEGRFWLFATEMREDADTRLCAYFAPSLFGPWTPHAANPIKIDVGGARPAGSPFLHEGRLFRPAQDGGRTYGGRIVLQEIVKLSPDVFEERAACAVMPSGMYPTGLHTMNSAGPVTLVDGKRSRFIGSPKVFFLRYGGGIVRRAVRLDQRVRAIARAWQEPHTRGPSR